MGRPTIPDDLKSAGFGHKEIDEVAAKLLCPKAKAITSISEALESIGEGASLADVLDYWKPGEQPEAPKKPAPAPAFTPKPDGLGAKAASGFNIGGYLAQMKEAVEASLLKPGRYHIRIADARVGSEANDLGLFYGVLSCEVLEHPETDHIPMFAAIDVSDEFKDEATGELKLDAMDPLARSRFLSGLSTVAKIISLAKIDADELAGAASAEEALDLFVGLEFQAVIAKGKDQNGLASNKIKSLTKAL